MKKTILFFIGLFALNLSSYSQTKSKPRTESPFIPSCGHDAKTVLKGAVKKGKYSSGQTNTPASLYPAVSIMNCGKFDVYFDDIAGGFTGGFADPVLGPVRRNTLCNVLTYIQNTFDFSNVNPSNPIRLLVLQSYYPGWPAPGGTDWLGIGTPGYFNTGAPSIKKGFVFDYVSSGVDPINPNNFHATLEINFDALMGMPILWQDDNTAPFSNCSYDLFTIMLHELTHTMGWFSLTNMVSGLPGSIIGSNQYSGLDYLVYKGSCLTPAGTTALDKLITGLPTSPTINPVLSTNTLCFQQRDIWINSLRAPWNYAVYSGSEPGNGHLYDINKTISHMDEQSWAFSARHRISPSYQPEYVMAPQTSRGQIKREYSKGEIQTLVTFGYALTSAYTTSYPHTLLNKTPYCARFIGSNNYQDDFFPDTIPADYFLTNNVGSSLTIDLTLTGLPYNSWWFDPDGDPKYVYPNSLYNIRGCGNGGNNHNCLSIAPGGQQIIFTPRPGFFGRAQFGFNLYDGKEKGGYIVMTIDVGKGSNTIPAPGSNMVMNGNFEEGTEVKRLGAEEAVPNTVYEYDRSREGAFRYGTIFGDCQIYNQANINGYFPSAPVPHFPSVVHDSQISCNGSIYTGELYSQSFFGSILPAHGQRYYNLFPSDYHNFTLNRNVVAGKAYTLEYDYFYGGSPIGSIPFKINFTNLDLISKVAYGTIPIPKNFQISTNFNSSSSGWTHVTQTFTYCGEPSDILNFSSSTMQLHLNIDNLSLRESASQPPSSLAVTDNVGGQSCLGKSVMMTVSGGNPFCGASSTYSWLPIYLTGTSVVVSPTATTVYTIVAGTNVLTTHTIFVNTLTVSISPSPTTVNCTGSPNVTLTASGASTYTWLPGPLVASSAVFTPVANSVYTVTGQDANGCTGTKTVSVTYNNAACACTSCNLTAVNTVTGGGTLSSAVYCINNSVTFTGTTTLSGDFKMGSGVVITITAGASLTLTNAHFYACSNMWQGFVVKNGGRLVITNSFIEDAITAIDVLNNTQTSNVLNITGTTFNRNKTAISVENYTQNSAAPFTITNCLFTCRSIPFSALSFPSAASVGAAASNMEAPLSNDWIDNMVYVETGAGAYLKAPFSSIKSSVGLRLKNVGRTLNPAAVAPTYYEFVLGSASSKTIFDNLATCVSLENSNYTSYNTIYQNTRGSGALTGIKATADRYNHNRIRVIPVSSTTNKFVDCATAVDATDYLVYDINNVQIKSTQRLPTATYWEATGINITTNRYKVMNVSDNTFINIMHNVNVQLRSGSFIIPMVSTSFGQYTGILTVNRNTFRPHMPMNAVTYQKVGGAINMKMSLSGVQVYDDPLTHLTQVDKNTIIDALVGIDFLTWKNHKVSVNTNNISLVDNSYQSYYPNYGIGMTANTSIVSGPIMVANNKVAGYGLANRRVHGIYLSSGDYFDLNCNDVSNVTNGLVFDFFNNNTRVYNNTMMNNKYGFTLDNSGIIGMQGSPSMPQDNMWPGPWIPPMYMTAVFNNSDAGMSRLFIRGAGMVPFDPNGSSLSTTPPIFSTEYSIPNGNLMLVGSAGPINPCPMFVSTARVASIGRPDRDSGKLLEYVAVYRDKGIVSQEADFIQKGQAYRILKQNPVLLTSSPELANFDAVARTSNYEEFYKIEQHISRGNFNDANALNKALTPVNKIEENQKIFYRLAAKSGLSTLNSQDSMSLRTIASLCPYSEGLVVFDARVLMYMLYKTRVSDNCESDRIVSAVDTRKETFASDLQIFPNPAINVLNVKCAHLKDGKANVLITDVNGRKLYEKNIQVSSSALHFEVDLKNGVYLVKIQQPETNTYSVKKVIIQK